MVPTAYFPLAGVLAEFTERFNAQLPSFGYSTGLVRTQPRRVATKVTRPMPERLLGMKAELAGGLLSAPHSDICVR